MLELHQLLTVFALSAKTCLNLERTQYVWSFVSLTSILIFFKPQKKGCQSATLQQVESLCCNVIFSLTQLCRTTPTPLLRSRVIWLTPAWQPDGCVLTSNWKTHFFSPTFFCHCFNLCRSLWSPLAYIIKSAETLTWAEILESPGF